VDDLLLVPASQILEGHAKAILLDMSPEIDHDIAVVFVHAGRQVEITYRPPAKAPPEWRATPCEADVLTVVSQAGKPVATSAILTALEAARLYHGESTVKRALAHLVSLGRLANGGRGYVVPAGAEARP
jgi:hypothetical protein